MFYGIDKSRFKEIVDIKVMTRFDDYLICWEFSEGR